MKRHSALASGTANSETNALIGEFGEIVGAKNVLSDAADMAGYVADWTGQYQAPALAVVSPQTTSEVAEVVKKCAAHGIHIVPQGGRTGICGGGVPLKDQSSIILSLAKMNAVRAVDHAGRTVIAEAGVVLENLHQKAAEHGLIFPLVFGAKGSCTIGGNLATNAGGSNVVRYGNTRELCLGIEAVMPDGTVINALSGLRKDNTGYDLKDLMIGSEGTLGIITAAVFRLFPEPKVRVTAFLSASSLDAAIDILNRLQDCTGDAVEAFEYMPQPAMDVICKAFPDTRRPLEGVVETGILVEVASSRPCDSEEAYDGTVRLQTEVMELLGALMEEGLVLDAMVAQSEQQRADLWKTRESMLEALTENGPCYHFDISLPLARIGPFVTEMDAEMAKAGFQPLTIGHLGDGNLHYALSAADGQDWDALPLDAAKERIFALLIQLNGSFSAEHGIGQSKLSVMAKLKETSQLSVMRAIKAALDPSNIMNPGKLIPDMKGNQ